MDIYKQQAQEELKIFLQGLENGSAIVEDDYIAVPYEESENPDRYIVYEFNNPQYIRDDNFSLQHMKISDAVKNKILNVLNDRYQIRPEIEDYSFDEEDITEMVHKAINLIKESITKWYVVEDGENYNVFPEEDLKQYGIEKDQIVKVFYNMDKAFDYAENLNRETQEQYGNFSPSKGYFDESKTKQLSLTESKLKSLIIECLNEVMDEEQLLLDDENTQKIGQSSYDNMTDEQVEQLQGNFYEVIVPEWALPALVNGDYEGLNDMEKRDIQSFERNFCQGGSCELANGLNVGDCCVPLDNASPSFESKNDINHEGAMCYKFALPAK